MPQSLAAIHLHIIFSTKNREPLIVELLAPRLHAYVGGIVRELECVPHNINGMDDHIHILASVAPKISVSEFIGKVKASASKWVHGLGPDHATFAWQRGYAAFSVSESGMDAVRKYIDNQREHHTRLSFKEEFVGFLERHRVIYDDRYVWD